MYHEKLFNKLCQKSRVSVNLWDLKILYSGKAKGCPVERSSQEIVLVTDTLYFEDLNFVAVNSLYQMAKKYDKIICKDFVSAWLKNQSTQQQTATKTIQNQYILKYSD